MKETLPVEFDKRDGMPVEVATKLLLEPRARMSAPMRRECILARQRTITSPTPIRSGATGYVTCPDQKRADYATKCARKARKLAMAKLCQLQATTAKRRLAVQRPFLRAEEELAKLQAQTDKEAVTKNVRRYQLVANLLTRLADEANRLDIIMDAVSEEIERRCLNGNSPEYRKKWLRK